MQVETSLTLEEIIIRATCLHFGLTMENFKNNLSKDQHSCYQRFICAFLLKEKTFLSNLKIAKLLYRGEGAVKHGCNSIRGLVDIKDRRTTADLKDIKEIIDSFIADKKQKYA